MLIQAAEDPLAAEFGVQFQTTDLRGTWFPPGLSLGRVTFDRPGEPLVLTAEDVRISFNLYAVLFNREKVSRLVLVRPRLYLPAGYPSMYEYCVNELRLSEDATYKRIQAARFNLEWLK